MSYNQHHVEVEFRNAQGDIVERIFQRAHEARYDYTTGVVVRTASEQFVLRDTSRVVRFDMRTIESTVTDWQRADLDADVRQLLRDRKKIPAIKLVRSVLGYGLREAKEYVERIEDIPF
tara:strand:- start:1464 stop:1820 length:357 start_codon:yes stop_codon:yes gene_type:complete